ncbi:MAG TPA: N-6 DNA methylase [Gemmatimonadaceae bacterium]
MQEIERAIELLREAHSTDGPRRILNELGFAARALPLDEPARNALGLPSELHSAHVAGRSNCLRALIVDLGEHPNPRDVIARVARALSRSAPQFLWIVCATRSSAREVSLAAWHSGPRIRLLSLVCQTDKLYPSDAETLCALASVGDDDDLVRHSRWLDILGREAITRRFFSTLQGVVMELADSIVGRASTAERSELALLYVSRLIFLAFLETKGWLDGDFGFLGNGYASCLVSGGRYQRRVLEPFFFGTLNTSIRQRSARAKAFGRIPFLNGGLFARSHLEKLRRDCTFSDDAFGSAYGKLLLHYRFSAREDSAEWSEASIDPEILGKTFEALMAAPDRKTSGAFYTPQELVEDVAWQALATLPDGVGRRGALTRVRVIDPACGSGAFLVHVLERISLLRRQEGESGSIADIRRRVLTSSIFGVDVNPMAVWLCELRLWLSIVIESDETDPMRIAPLPNLDRHIRVGDSLAAGAFDDRSDAQSGRRVVALRARYSKAIGLRKRTLARGLDRLERSAAIESLTRARVRLAAERKEILLGLRARDLFGERPERGADVRRRLADLRSRAREFAQRSRALRAGAALPFSFAAHFPDVGANRGFDLVVGNPPWVRVHRIPKASRDRLQRDFSVYRSAAWQEGAAIAGAGRGFAAQVDMAALFVERSCELLRPGGTMSLLLPAKLWRSLASGGVRRLLLERMKILALEDLANAQSQFDAAVYPCLVVATRRREPEPDTGGTERPIAAGIHAPHGVSRWTLGSDRLSFDGSPGSPWLVVPASVRDAFDRVAAAGKPFHQTEFGRPLLGVKTGHNAAYLVRVESFDGSVARISAAGRTGTIERELLRPLIRGENLDAWTLVGPREYIVWPHDAAGYPLRELPPLARHWLARSHDPLSARSDLHGRFPWWSLFRTESAAARQSRVIWADIGREPRALVVDAGEPFVALNTCYVVHCPTIDDAHALATVLNSPVAASWLNALAEPARGAYRRYLGWTVSLLPLPRDWHRAREILSPLGQAAMDGRIPATDVILGSVLDAYRLDVDEIDPLLTWTSGSD